MIALAGHGKNSRLIQLPVLPIIEGDENYTPNYFFVPCKKFLKGFDLDPFSCELANQTITAETFWSKENDALIQDWTRFKRKWVNPPYSSGLIGKAIAKTLEYSHIGETLLLVNTSSSAKWFQACMEKCAAYLHPSKRINFNSPFRSSKSNRYDQTLFYFGDRPLEFAEALSNLGNAVQPIRKLCLPTSTISGELELLALQPETLEKSRPSPMLIPAEMRKKSTKRTSLKSRSTQISETVIPQKELTCLQGVSPAQEPVLQEVKLDSTTPNLQCGLNISDASKKDSPSLSLSRTQQDYSIAEWELSYKGYPKAGTMRNGKLSPLPSLEVPKRGKEFLSLPTLTSNTATDSSRASGQSKLERWLKDKGFLQDTQVLSAEMMATLFGFPKDWTLCLSDATGERLGELDLDIFSDGRSISTVQPLSSNESSTSIAFSVNNINASSSAKLDFLLEQRDRLISSGASPQGVWINCGKVPKRDFRQAVWKSDKPRSEWGDKKSKYIGEFGKESHISAIAQHRAGQELRKIEREIKSIQKKLEKS